jgi:L-threonylcarbamoyladenylate synthase
LESTVISLLDPERPKLLRPGVIGKEHLEELLKCPIDHYAPGDPVTSPGIKYRHYAPQASIKLFSDWKTLELYLKGALPARRILLSSYAPYSLPIEQWIFSRKNFYHSLRLADQQGYEELLVFCSEEILQDFSLMNRLTRAAGKTE